MAILITLLVYARNLLGGSRRRKYFDHISLVKDAWGLGPGLKLVGKFKNNTPNSVFTCNSLN